jgi:hypothetical protein
LRGALILYKKWKIKANGIGKILHGNCLLKHIIEGKMEGRIKVTEEDVSNYWMILGEIEGNVN